MIRHRDAYADFGAARWIGFDPSAIAPYEATAFVCFRHEFQWEPTAEEAYLHITADYRYTVWINGALLGHGPVRGWPEEWFYDTYEADAWLRPGANTIAVLVHVLNEATFQYVPGKPGLLARLEGTARSGAPLEVGTGDGWQWRQHPSFAGSTPRISTQQSYSEQYNALLEPEGWMHAGFRTDEAWREAVPLGPVGCAPWGPLRPRDIPLLTEDEWYPATVRTLETVELPEPAWSLNLRPWLLPGVADASPHPVRGLLVTTVTLDAPARVRFGMQDRTSGVYAKLHVNGTAAVEKDVSGYHWCGCYEFEAELEAGTNVLAFFMDRAAHDFHFQAAVRDESGRSMRLEPGLPGIAEGRFAVVPGDDLDEAKLRQLLEAADWEQWTAAAEGRRMQVVPAGREHGVNVFHLMTDAIPIRDVPPSAAAENVNASCGGNADYALLHDPGEGKAVRLVYEFEAMTAGWIEFEVWAEAGAVLDGYGFEAYEGDRIVHMGSIHNTVRYVARQGWQRYRSYFHRGFRYWMLQASALGGDLKIRFVRCIQRTYPSPPIGRFRCADESLNRIFEMCRRTAQLCSDDTFVDCPTYEQAFWVGDAYVMAAVQNTLAGAEPLVRRSLRLAGSSMRRSPVVESHVPSGWPNVLSTWSLLWAIACEEHYRHTGDRSFAEELYPLLIGQVRFFRDECTDEATALIRSPFWNLIDWAPMDVPDGVVSTPMNVLFAESCRRTASLADVLGREREAEELRRLSASIVACINAHLWSEERQAFADCMREPGRLSPVFSEQTNLLCYLYEACRPERRSVLAGYVREAPADFVRSSTPFMRYFKLQAMEKAGLYVDLLREVRQAWGYMLEQGSTTCWEDMPGRWAPGYPTRSYCHGWSVGPAHMLPKIALGIAPASAGWSRVRIAPQPVHLPWCEGKLHTPHGDVSVRWEKGAREFTASVSLPPGVAGELVLPMESSRVGRIVTEGSGSGDKPYLSEGKWAVRIGAGETLEIRASVRSW
ncbi:alpha-L-rhamnosidase C-terminal domain-containing protein [Paenibacillus flagellatus]|uniref:alpha-L-rhamnosidase-related protein n=1 Tax=Paenibacillus flagellatus TaxID=2211139 RepID=UPI001305312C|nr:alpha-L-rhamnosidase C-terminal domain-containing protein [Paenibacillus flagellatus]